MERGESKQPFNAPSQCIMALLGFMQLMLCAFGLHVC